MGSLFWHLTNRTAETLLILNLFHLLLCGLTLLILLHQRFNRGMTSRPDRLVTGGIALLTFYFAALTLRFGIAFFLREQFDIAGLERITHSLLVMAILIITAGYLDAAKRSLAPAIFNITVLVVLSTVDAMRRFAVGADFARPHSLAMMAADALAIASLLLAMSCVARGDCGWEGRRFRLMALACLALVFALHALPQFVSATAGTIVWNAGEHIFSIALFVMTWAVGERSHILLDRVFVRLNLTFLVLASVIMLITAGMEKYQYFRLAEERSLNLAEFVRGHVLYYEGQGENLDQIFAHPEVLRRVVTEFGSLPELREVDVYVAGRHAAFRYGDDWEVRESITSESADATTDSNIELHDQFSMIRLPIRDGGADHIEFIGTLDYVNEYIGKYIILIYCTFTLMVGLGTAVIGMIVSDTDRQLQRQYSELQEAQQQLAQSAKLAAIGELAGGMAHEINNPITSILVLASHMADGNNAGALNARGRRNLQTIVRQTERVAALVRGLLTFSRQTQLHLSEVNVAEVLNTALDLVRYRFEQENVVVRKDLDGHLRPVIADSSRLTEVFVNLLRNALDAMPAGGTLTVRASQNAAEGGVRVEVQDTGEGIAPEQLSRIFDPFFTTKPPGRGTGLGLSISHGIVKDHGGEIRAISDPGVGTTISVFLPWQAAPVSGAQYEAASAGH